MIETNADHATVAGGLNNRIQRFSFRGVISGGETNVIETNVFAGTIGGGTFNRIGTNSSYATIGGTLNVISNGPVSFGLGAGTIGGGYDNYNSGWAATIAGGWQNIVTGTSDFIGGGTGNSVSNDYSRSWADILTACSLTDRSSADGKTSFEMTAAVPSLAVATRTSFLMRFMQRFRAVSKTAPRHTVSPQGVVRREIIRAPLFGLTPPTLILHPRLATSFQCAPLVACGSSPPAPA